MKIQFRFFDKEEWSIFATLQTIIILAIYRLGFKKFDLKLLVLSSLIAMMQGDMIPRVIFAFFLSLIVWSKDEYLIGTVLTVLAAGITGLIPQNNPVHNLFMKNQVLKYSLLLCVLIWFGVISYMIYEERLK